MSCIDADEASLTRGSEKLSCVENLRVPVSHQLTTNVQFDDTQDLDCFALSWQNGCMIPGAVSLLAAARVVHVADVTRRDARVVKKFKRAIHVELDANADESRKILRDYDAGDSLYFTFENLANEVDIILERMNLTDRADLPFRFTRKDDSFLEHIPNPCSCRYLLVHCLDIRRSPGRPLLRTLAEFCSNLQDKRRLLELCSVQGTNEFTNLVRKTGISFVDLLMAFPSCRPSIECLMELLPRLLPRPYSIANYAKPAGNARLCFVYSLLETPSGRGVRFARYGACSGWLNARRVGDVIRVALKEPSKFRLPPILKPNLDILRCPLILVGPGTGLAPFISFLQKIEAGLIESNEKPANVVPRMLFYGSSDLSEEFLFKDELERLRDVGVLTDLVLCESRPKESHIADGEPRGPHRPKYVYDGLRERSYDVIKLLVADEDASNPKVNDGAHRVNYNSVPPAALLYACGDVKNMSKQMWTCLGEMCVECLGFFDVEVNAFLQRLRTAERFIEDVWS